MKIKNQKVLVGISLLLYITVLFTYNLGNSVMPAFLRSTRFGTEVFGFLTAFMFLGQFMIAPFWGQLSDKKGRWIIMLSPLFYGVGQVLYILSINSFMLLVFSRVFSGLFSILFVSQFVAFISDITPPKHRRKVLSWLAIMGPLSGGSAYLIGGYLKSDALLPFLAVFEAKISFLGPFISRQFSYGYTFPFVLQLFTGIILSGVLYFFIKSNSHYQMLNSHPSGQKRKFFDFNLLVRYKGTVVFSIILVTFFNSIAYSATHSIQYYLQDSLGLDAQNIGLVVFIYSIGSVVISLILQPFFFKFFNDWTNLLIANATVILLALALSFSNITTLVIIMSVIIMMNTLLIAINQTLLAHATDVERGTLIGLNQSSQSLGGIFGNFIISPLYAFMPDITNHRLPFYMMAIVLLIVTVIIIGPLKKQLLSKK
ncbi:MAG: MFS transporter [Culicoidibacterales bacterium]